MEEEVKTGAQKMWESRLRRSVSTERTPGRRRYTDLVPLKLEQRARLPHDDLFLLLHQVRADGQRSILDREGAVSMPAKWKNYHKRRAKGPQKAIHWSHLIKPQIDSCELDGSFDARRDEGGILVLETWTACILGREGGREGGR